MTGTPAAATARLADFALGLRHDEIPAEVARAAKLHLLDEAAVVAKFRANAELALDPDRVEALADTVLRLDELENAAAALATLRQARSSHTTEMAA